MPRDLSDSNSSPGGTVPTYPLNPFGAGPLPSSSKNPSTPPFLTDEREEKEEYERKRVPVKHR